MMFTKEKRGIIIKVTERYSCVKTLLFIGFSVEN